VISLAALRFHVVSIRNDDTKIIEMKLPLRQSGVIPFRRTGADVEVLLVTSRETGRWVIPKGGIQRGLTAAQSAEHEALEEAGVKGKIRKKPLGSYTYSKRLSPAISVPAIVEVFALQVNKCVKKWPEMSEREIEWVDVPTATDLVHEDGLKVLLRRLERMKIMTG